MSEGRTEGVAKLAGSNDRPSSAPPESPTRSKPPAIMVDLDEEEEGQLTSGQSDGGSDSDSVILLNAS